MTFREMWQQLMPLYDEGEAKAIVRLLLETRCGLSYTDIVAGEAEWLSPSQLSLVAGDLRRLSLGEPLQYVVGRATFRGREFIVSPSVLIPRPETEELCAIASGLCRRGRVLDIGTGSGCIAITLALEMEEAVVEAWDVSEQALSVARENAYALNATVSFTRHDILAAEPPSQPLYNLIVSNPPYICHSEKETMHTNVLCHEPHLALFVPDDDPLLFYRAIARYASRALQPGGFLVLEINPLYADGLRELLHDADFTLIEIRDDEGGRPRIAVARQGDKGVARHV